jgi:hypothetical protein
MAPTTVYEGILSSCLRIVATRARISSAALTGLPAKVSLYVIRTNSSAPTIAHLTDWCNDELLLLGTLGVLWCPTVADLWLCITSGKTNTLPRLRGLAHSWKRSITHRGALHWRLRHFSFEPHRIEEKGEIFTHTLSITQGRQRAFDRLSGTNPQSPVI